MKYVSTRGGAGAVSAAEAIVAGLAPDRGLYVPETLPKLFGEDGDGFDMAAVTQRGYYSAAEQTLLAYFKDFSRSEIETCAAGAYDEKFDTPEIAPVTKAGGAYFLELWHGSTAAFKDMALSILPYLLKLAVHKIREDKKIVILTATSGDTGKAALAGFADVPGTEIIVFYPSDGVSAVQKRQMITQVGANVHVFGIRGNFDDAQTGVKSIFSDRHFAEELAAHDVRLSSANSINIGRLIPQVAYYVNSWIRLMVAGEIAKGESINVCVPTGNFGNILAAWYAKQLGVPIARLLCASNENKVLTDFIRTGVYDTKREFVLTSSPSMDILVSSNLERLLWHLSGGDGERILDMMRSLDTEGSFDAGDLAHSSLSEFHAGHAPMLRSHAELARLWNEERYLIDTHTAVAYTVWKDYAEETGDHTKTLIASTASPYKFAGSVAISLGLGREENEFAYIEKIREHTGVPVPYGLMNLDKKPVLHGEVIFKSDIKNAVKRSV
ncbi:MAG: threonine synthase [Clostridiales Family XIII bacterium]|nr:threonine synthase [Clostridiales Family XIII bacterium]